MISDRNALFFRTSGIGSSLPPVGISHLLTIAWVSGGLCRGCWWVVKGFLRGVGGVVADPGRHFSATNHPVAAISQSQPQASSLPWRPVGPSEGGLCGSLFPLRCSLFSALSACSAVKFFRLPTANCYFPKSQAPSPQPLAPSYCSAKPSVASISLSTIPGSVMECPASGITCRSASGQARCRSQALVRGQTTS